MPSVGGDGHPNAIAITPNGRTVYIPGADAKVHTIAVAANKPGPVIAVGNEATAVAITPNGETAYVAAGAGKIYPTTIATNQVRPAITVEGNPAPTAVTPNGRTIYVVNDQTGTVTPLAISTQQLPSWARAPSVRCARV